MIRVLVLSSVLPERTAGGPLLLYRHLKRLPSSSFTCLVANASDNSSNLEFPEFRLERRAKSWLARSPLKRLVNNRESIGEMISDRHVKEAISSFQADVILTVAHGELFHVALRQSQELNIPLVSIYHDWWPDKVKGSRYVRKLATEDFLAAANHGTALCVCEGMLEALGSPANGQVLYPIHEPPQSSDFPKSEIELHESRLLRVGYAGNLTGPYGRMIASLSDHLRVNDQISLSYRGRKPVWIHSEYAGEYGGFLTPSDTLRYLRENDVLLVTMSFEKGDERKSQTSFPSKIVDYCLVKRPILVWGPSSCSAVRWAKESSAAAVVDSPDPTSVCDTLNRLSSDPVHRETLVKNASQFAMSVFCEESLQQQFQIALVEACGQDRKLDHTSVDAV